MQDREITEEINKTITFKLTTEEIAEKGKTCAEISREIGEMNEEFDSVKKSWKGKIESQELALRRHLMIIRHGEEDRNVVCKMIKDYNRMVVSYEFNGSIVEERAMTMEERQIELLPGSRKRILTSDDPNFDLPVDDEIEDVRRSESGRKTKVSSLD